MKNNILKLLFFFMISNIITANVTLPNIFGDNMVLQRNSEVKIWGWANPKEEIKLVSSWNNQEYKAVTSNQAKWELVIKTPEAGGPYTISIKGYNEVILKNILIGEVWICSGQSNMEMSASWGIDNGDEEVKNATNPNIRFFTVSKSTATSPQNNVLGNWVESTPETMKYFSAVGYFFAKRLREDLKNVPIGLISSNWGGTPAEIWMPEEVVQNDTVLLENAKKLYEQEYGPHQPGRAYNAMIAPIVGFKIAGTLWYQGESNVGSLVYDKTLSALITSWRKNWNDEFPFYFVQIAPYKTGTNNFSNVTVRNSQRKILKEVPKTGMVLTSDISDTIDIHPKNKKSVGIRLANLVLAETYKVNSNLVNGPLFKEIKIDKNKVSVSFDYAEGLYFKDKISNQFEVAGAEGNFFPAEASIKNNQVILTSKKVTNPAKVRFAWGNTTQSDLFNKANLPASCFITE
ncbi:sialate O-acetylesterase [Flavobacterium sp. CF108]|uniref:sialate O-acetylesterase n=1 Tax=unclassified Flavobacterium TaxID=196869 RepID=UPI0008C1A166|nr:MULTISPECIES: sialate O-acetylesterase [unclassified Flavobacterium]SEN85437.1 sialate O-acetylesterase [Flavobacterium sp. fv08]SHH20870.1 sialate O-acetylesterase [Flavobacterium sp. CF108]